MRTSISPLSGATSTAVTPAWFRWRGSAPASSSATATYTRWQADGEREMAEGHLRALTFCMRSSEFNSGE